MTWHQWTTASGNVIKPVFGGLLANGLGNLLFGELGGFALAIGVGMIVGSFGRGPVGSGVGGCWGAKSATIGYALDGTVFLSFLYAAAVGVALAYFTKSVHTTWKQGIEKAQADYEFYYGNAHSGQCSDLRPDYEALSDIEIPILSQAV